MYFLRIITFFHIKEEYKTYHRAHNLFLFFAIENYENIHSHKKQNKRKGLNF